MGRAPITRRINATLREGPCNSFLVLRVDVKDVDFSASREGRKNSCTSEGGRASPKKRVPGKYYLSLKRGTGRKVRLKLKKNPSTINQRDDYYQSKRDGRGTCRGSSLVRKDKQGVAQIKRGLSSTRKPLADPGGSTSEFIHGAGNQAIAIIGKKRSKKKRRGE